LRDRIKKLCKKRKAFMGSEDANVWVARPQEVDDEQMRSLEVTLDGGEIERASRFRFESDRRAYVVAHGLRRVALGDWLGVHPGNLVFARQSSGKPLLIWPDECEVCFSHAHTRELVAPVGIDVECVVQTQPDFDLLAPYVVLPEASERVAELGASLPGQFYFYWTALEAFWKAAGIGLSPGNPRIRCKKNETGSFEVTLEGDVGDRQCLTRATVSRIQAPEGCMISLAHNIRSTPPNGRVRHRLPDSASAGELTNFSSVPSDIRVAASSVLSSFERLGVSGND
jgi:4'-phosphopantetheinyl transferase